MSANIIISICLSGGIAAALFIAAHRVVQPARKIYESHDDCVQVEGRVSCLDDDVSFGFGKKSETAYPIYKAKVDGRFVRNPGIIRYKVEDLMKMKKTGEKIELYYDRKVGQLWRLAEIPARMRQIYIQAAVVAVAVAAVVIVPSVMWW